MPYQPTNRYTAPPGPLHSDYAPPSPPRYAVPGSKSAKDKAQHIIISLCSTGGFIWTWQNAGDSWRLLLIPLTFAALWPFLPMLQDWLITWHLKRHSETYVYSHDLLSQELKDSQAEWSAKHNATRRNRQDVTLKKSQEQERLEAMNSELAERLRAVLPDQSTRILSGYTPTMRRLIDLARENEAGVVSDRRAQAAGISQRQYIPARDTLLAAGVLYKHGQVFRLQPEYLMADNPHSSIEERIAA